MFPYTNFRIFVLVVKNVIGILMGNIFKLQIILVSMYILIILILPIHEHGRSSISFISVLYFSFRGLSRRCLKVPKVFLGVAVVNGIALNILFSKLVLGI